MKPSELCQVFVDAIEAQAVPSADKAHAGDKFNGIVGPPALDMDRHFGVECNASIRRNINGCRTEHTAVVTLTFVYMDTSDTEAYKRIIDDMALVAEAVHDVRQSGVTNATDILQHVIVSGGDVLANPQSRTLEMTMQAEVVYTYD